MNRSNLLDRAATAITVLCALFVAAVVARREFMSPPQPPVAGALPVQRWDSYVSEHATIGRADAPVTLVVFSDFECPFCRTFARTLDSLQLMRPGEFRISFRHLPITRLHPYAAAAATAAQCAAAQSRFEVYHNALFAGQDTISRLDWGKLAEEVGIPDTGRFTRCIAEHEPSELLTADSLAAIAVGVNGTPTVITNGWKWEGALPLARLDSIISASASARRVR